MQNFANFWSGDAFLFFIYMNSCLKGKLKKSAFFLFCNVEIKPYLIVSLWILYKK